MPSKDGEEVDMTGACTLPKRSLWSNERQDDNRGGGITLLSDFGAAGKWSHTVRREHFYSGFLVII